MTSLSLAVVLAEAARWRPDKVGVIDPWERVTFADMWSQSLGVAGALAGSGIQPDDHVALMCPNVADLPRAYFGILSAGAVVVPVHLLLTADEVAHVLRDNAATTLLCHSSQLEVGARAASAVGIPVIVLGPLPAASAPSFASMSALVQQSTPLPPFVSREAEDAAVIFYTSGTTGTSKGAVLTQLNMVMNATVGVYDTLDTHPDDIGLGCLPLFHVFGQSVSMNGAFRRGSTLVLLPRFSGDAAIDTMLAENVNTLHGVPRRFEEVFGTTIYEGYGLSETSPSATANDPTFGTRAGIVGHPVWGVQVEIARAEIDERFELLGPDDLGEVVMRGHNVFAGYWGRPEATAAAVVDGWFRTGDLGSKDRDGFISIVDRKKDVVIRGGFNVYPSEVEEVLARHPSVAQVAVIGLPDDVYGEEVVAVVVPRAEPPFPPEAEFVAWSREHLARTCTRVGSTWWARCRWGRARRCSNANCAGRSARRAAEHREPGPDRRDGRPDRLGCPEAHAR